MTSLLPWRRSKSNLPAIGGPLSRMEDFPFALSRMREEFDRMFEQLARDLPASWNGAGWRWGLDVSDEENAIVVRAEAPGFEAGDFDVQVCDGTLTLKALRKTETGGKEGEPREYREQQCYESVFLPAGIDANKVAAKYHNGVLTVTLPKTAASKAKRIAVTNA